jgi:hypothetical protein
VRALALGPGRQTLQADGCLTIRSSAAISLQTFSTLISPWRGRR